MLAGKEKKIKKRAGEKNGRRKEKGKMLSE